MRPRFLLLPRIVHSSNLSRPSYLPFPDPTFRPRPSSPPRFPRASPRAS
jgi:hypothetical protein